MGRCHSRCSDLFKNGETWKNSLRDFIPNAEGYLWGSRWRGQELIALLLVVFEGQRKINILCNRTDARGSRKEPLSGRFRFQKCLHLSSATPEVVLQRRRLTHTITVFMLDYSYLHRVPPAPIIRLRRTEINSSLARSYFFIATPLSAGVFEISHDLWAANATNNVITGTNFGGRRAPAPQPLLK
jgi:hypothetical protein